MGQPILQHETSIQDSLVKAILVTVALSIVIGVVFFCLPNKGRIARFFGRERAAVGEEFPPARVGYDNPMVRSTLDIPWAHHARHRHAHKVVARNG
jgi:hypothetical protein